MLEISAFSQEITNVNVLKLSATLYFKQQLMKCFDAIASAHEFKCK